MPGETVIIQIARLFQKSDDLGDDLFRVPFFCQVGFNLLGAPIPIGEESIGCLLGAIDRTR